VRERPCDAGCFRCGRPPAEQHIVREGEPVRVEKMVAFYASQDRAINETLGNAGSRSRTIPSFAEAPLERHGRAWEELWEVCDLRLQRSTASR
jgi:trehalose/maltose hydrolase-like predicted phosphorylase